MNHVTSIRGNIFKNTGSQDLQKYGPRMMKIFTLVLLRVRVIVMVFNVTFNNILVISWWSALLVVETGVPGENHRPVVSH